MRLLQAELQPSPTQELDIKVELEACVRGGPLWVMHSDGIMTFQTAFAETSEGRWGSCFGTNPKPPSSPDGSLWIDCELFVSPNQILFFFFFFPMTPPYCWRFLGASSPLHKALLYCTGFSAQSPLWVCTELRPWVPVSYWVSCTSPVLSDCFPSKFRTGRIFRHPLPKKI